MEKQYYAIFDRQSRQLYGIDYCYPYQQTRLPVPDKPIPQVIAILVPENEINYEAGIRLKDKYNFTYIDDFTVQVEKKPPMEVIINNPLLYSFKEYVEALQEQKDLTKGYKDNLISLIKIDRSKFIDQGFLWISSEGDMNVFECSRQSIRNFISRLTVRINNPAARKTSELVKFGVHEHAGREYTEMSPKEFQIFCKNISWYEAVVEAHAAKLINRVKQCELAEALVDISSIDYPSCVAEIPIAYDIRSLKDKTVAYPSNRRLIAQDKRLKKLTALTDKQLEKLDLSLLTDNQRLVACERLGLSEAYQAEQPQKENKK